MPPGASALTPQVVLATSVHAQPGAYAVLIGSGASTAAGIPTGWGVVQNLVGRVAAAANPEEVEAAFEAANDAEAWWAEHGSGELGYSTLLAALAPTPAARQALLAGFFDQTEEDREQGVKGPTATHVALARLVKRGSVRVVLTTNFDRLIERALEGEGVSPQVIARPEAVAGMTPLAHTAATVIKLHGDYADLDIRNTVDELSTYPAEWDSLLDQVFDEYGLLIVGWSGEWDPALRAALERVASRRYLMFWDSRSGRGENAKRLIDLRGMQVVPADSADTLLTSLLSSVEALDKLAEPPLTTAMAVARLKRWLPDPLRRIDLYDLVMEAVDHAVEEIQAQPISIGGLTTGSLEGVLASHRAATVPLLSLLVEGVRHDSGLAHEDLWAEVIERLLAARRQPTGTYQEALASAQHLPALLAFYSLGFTALVRNRDRLLIRLGRGEWWTDPHNRSERVPTAQALHPYRVLSHVTDLPRWGDTRWLYPASHFLREDLHDVLRPLVASDDDYKDVFDDLEYRVGLLQAFLDQGTNAYSVAAGEYVGEWRWAHGNGPRAEVAFRRDAQRSGDDWPWWTVVGPPDDFDDKILGHREVLAQMRRFG